MNSSKSKAILLTILLIACFFSSFTAEATDEGEGSIEGEETEWWENWYRDKNHNKIDDKIEDLAENDEIGIFIDDLLIGIRIALCDHRLETTGMQQVTQENLDFRLVTHNEDLFLFVRLGQASLLNLEKSVIVMLKTDVRQFCMKHATGPLSIYYILYQQVIF